MRVVLSLVFILVVLNAFAVEDCIPVDRIYQSYRQIQGEIVATRTGLQGDLYFDGGEISFTTSDGHRGEMLAIYRNGVLDVLGAEVDLAIRGEGVQTTLFNRLIEIIKSRGPINRINMGTNMIDDNKRAFLSSMAQRLNISFDPNLSAMQLESFLMSNHRSQVEGILANASQVEAILADTPAWKTRSRYGFSRICPDGNYIRISMDTIYIRADACLP